MGRWSKTGGVFKDGTYFNPSVGKPAGLLRRLICGAKAPVVARFVPASGWKLAYTHNERRQSSLKAMQCCGSQCPLEKWSSPGDRLRWRSLEVEQLNTHQRANTSVRPYTINSIYTSINTCILPTLYLRSILLPFQGIQHKAVAFGSHSYITALNHLFYNIR